MKWLRTLVIFDKGDLISTTDWQDIHISYKDAIEKIEHPENATKLRLRRRKKNEKGKWTRNGVGFLRDAFFGLLTTDERWISESQQHLEKLAIPALVINYPVSKRRRREPVTSKFGPFDFVTKATNGTRVAIEWETGNISSSHRSLNKLTMALAAGKIDVGVLIVPSRDLYLHLTDRIGNIGELSPYLSMWNQLANKIPRGLLAITVVEHDELTDDESVPFLSSGTDGNSEKDLE